MHSFVTPRRALALSATLSAVIYGVAFLLPYPLLANFETPLQDLGKITRYGGEAALLFVSSFVALFALYALGYRALATPSSAGGERAIVASAPIVFSILLLWVFPIGAIDVYDYTFYGKMVAHYGSSPLSHLPQDFGQDAWLPYVGWPQAVSPYGPLWQWFSGGIYMLSQGNLLANLLGYKALAASAVFLCAVVVYQIMRSTAPERALQGFYFIAWNPLLLVESAANAHNDTAMVLFVVLCLLAFQQGRLTLAGIALVCAMMIKLPAAIVAPVYGVAALRRLPNWSERARWLVVTAVAAAAVALLLYAPLAERRNLFSNVLTRAELMTTSIAAVAYHALWRTIGVAEALGVARAVAAGLLAAAMAIVLWRQRGSTPSLARGMFTSLFALLALATLWFQPWYVAWVLALAPLAGPLARRAAGVFSFSVLTIYLIYDFVLYWNVDFWYWTNEGLTLNLVTTALVLAPPLAVAAIGALQSVRARIGGHRTGERMV